MVATANYIARRYGVHSAMPLRTARRLCPHGIYLHGNHRLYRDYSRRLMALLNEYSPLVEQVSLDEAYVDLTGTERLFGPVTRTARAIQRRVEEELDLSISVGLATNKLVAKVASDFRKPRGFTVVAPGTETEFLAPLPVERLPGSGTGPAGPVARSRRDDRRRPGPGAGAAVAALVRAVGRAAGPPGSRGGSAAGDTPGVRQVHRPGDHLRGGHRRRGLPGVHSARASPRTSAGGFAAGSWRRGPPP